MCPGHIETVSCKNITLLCLLSFALPFSVLAHLLILNLRNSSDRQLCYLLMVCSARP